MPGNTSMAVAPAAGAGEPGSGSGETARHAAPRGAGRPSYELLSKYRGVLMGVQILLIMAFHYTEDLRTRPTISTVPLRCSTTISAVPASTCS